MAHGVANRDNDDRSAADLGRPSPGVDECRGLSIDTCKTPRSEHAPGTKAMAAPRSSYPFGGAPRAGLNVSVYLKSVLKLTEEPGSVPVCVPVPELVS